MNSLYALFWIVRNLTDGLRSGFGQTSPLLLHIFRVSLLTAPDRSRVRCLDGHSSLHIKPLSPWKYLIAEEPTCYF